MLMSAGGRIQRFAVGFSFQFSFGLSLHFLYRYVLVSTVFFFETIFGFFPLYLCLMFENRALDHTGNSLH